MEKVLLKVKVISVGMHPDERLIEIMQSNGIATQSLAWTQQIHGDFVEVTPPLLSRDNSVLIQLPQETVAGFWRIWVDPNDLKYEN